MKGKLYLIGGGEIAKGETKVIDQDLKINTKLNSKLVFFATAANDAPGYIETIKNTFNDHFEVVTAIKEGGKEEAQKLIKAATVIYLGGGQTELLLNLFKEWDLLVHLKKAYENGAIIAGMSAGALALSSLYVDNEGEKLQIREAWGLFDACIHVHATEKEAIRMNEFYQKNKTSDKKFIAIAENSAWVVSDNEINIIGKAWSW